ncbi:hypothetical protein EDC01DRAFT_344525 [Geopyxis carbonaria]|nr:hypothetical protein EDC01DRAFT_344525 [Geopyxis carbonaria]
MTDAMRPTARGDGDGDVDRRARKTWPGLARTSGAVPSDAPSSVFQRLPVPSRIPALGTTGPQNPTAVYPPPKDIMQGTIHLRAERLGRTSRLHNLTSLASFALLRTCNLGKTRRLHPLHPLHGSLGLGLASTFGQAYDDRPGDNGTSHTQHAAVPRNPGSPRITPASQPASQPACSERGRTGPARVDLPRWGFHCTSSDQRDERRARQRAHTTTTAPAVPAPAPAMPSRLAAARPAGRALYIYIYDTIQWQLSYHIIPGALTLNPFLFLFLDWRGLDSHRPLPRLR